MKNCTKIVIFQEFFKAQQETCGGKELVIKSAVQLSCGEKAVHLKAHRGFEVLI